MTADSVSQIIRVADAEVTLWILEKITPKTLRLAPAVGFEPTTNRLTADRSTTELRWIKFFSQKAGIQFAQRITSGKFVSKSARFDLVAGAGFEPAVRQLPDYEPPGCKPVIA
jgi:hypothetical protein